ncbi:hypothetical protein TSUD_22760 [Trifolium subterraneum]|uniref:Reverse transcriptase zinc-binding domain-containing protein n=1 Tax=Trifolium subterraneum TaxID=3900 RepID=A0A2Z6NMU3_TRISU|nr:hypothetical protein TSUD_22760 [Trifolium subterraneum]
MAMIFVRGPVQELVIFQFIKCIELCSDLYEPVDSMIARVWKINGLERIRCFVWLLKHDRLLTNNRLNFMHLVSAYCHHWRDTIEMTLHLFDL